MLIELNLGEMTVLQLQQHLMRTIRMEYDHNLSQQIYVSEHVWQAIILSRDQMIAFINTIAQQVPQDSSAFEYAKVLITAYANNGETANSKALIILKTEAMTLL